MAPPVYRVTLGLMLLLHGLSSIAANESDICRQVSKEVRKAERRDRLPDFATPLDEVPLCFRQYQACDKGAFQAERFWETTKNPEDAKAIRAELTDSYGYGGDVTRIRVSGRSDPVVRIARHVGTAHCIRDTYLEKHAGGYRLVDNESLQELSQEAGNCNGSYLSYLNLHGRTYAALVNFAEDWIGLTVMKADTSLNLTEVCSTKWKPKPRECKPYMMRC